MSKKKQRRLSKQPDRPQTQLAIQAKLQVGLAFLREGRLDEAEKVYAEFLQWRPNHFGALNLLGMIACQNRDYKRAVELISKAVLINSTDALAYCNLGIALRALDRREEAVVSYDKAIAIKPDSARAHYDRGIILQELNRLEEAVASYNKSILLEPNHEVYYNRGKSLKDLGRLEEAIESYDKAIALNSEVAEAYSNRGNALAELRRFEDALISYDRAIAIKPDYAGAYSNRGATLYELSRFDDALASYDQAIALKPDYALAYSNRGNALHQLKRTEEALGSYDRAIALEPDYADAYFNRGNILRELNRAHDALADYRKAIALKPDFADAYDNLGQLLREFGRLDEARSAFVRALDINPLHVNAHYDLADSKKFMAGDPDLAAMLKLTASPGALSETGRIQLDFALGKAFADLQDHRRSFQHLLVANARKRGAIHYDEKAMLALFDRIETICTRELIAAKSGCGNSSRRPIFIVGMPRSGTTLIEQILASHPLVHGAGELNALSEVVRAMPRPGSEQILYPDFVLGLDRAAFADIATRYLAVLAQHAPDCEYVTDKMPSNFLLVALIHLALPNAKIIHAIRDPIDTCISCFSKLFTVGQEHTYDLGELGRYYARYKRLMEHWHRVLPSDRILDVHYEDVVGDIEAQARRIISHCGLVWDERCLAFHETDRLVRTASASQVRQRIYQSAIGRWRHYEEFLGPLLKALGIESANLMPGQMGTFEAGILGTISCEANCQYV